MMEQNSSDEIDSSRLSFMEKITVGGVYLKLIYKDNQPHDFLILSANSSFEKMTGKKDIAGQKLCEVIPGLNESNPEIIDALLTVALKGDEKRLESFIKPINIFAGILIISEKKDYVNLYMDDTTSRKQAEEKLKASESRYRNLFDNMAEGFALYEAIKDDSGKVVDALLLNANLAFQKQTGMRIDDILEKTMMELFPQTGPLELDSSVKIAFGGGIENKELYSYDLERYFRQLTFSPEPGKFAYLFDDITDRKVAEKALAESERKFRTLAENADDIIMRFGKEHKHLYVNSAAVNYFKINASDFLSKTNAELGFLKEEYEYWHKRIDEVFSTGKSFREIAPVNNGEFWFDWSLIPEFDSEGNVSTVMSISRDVTTLKKTEKELAERERYYRMLFEDHEAVQLIVDPMTGLIVDANKAAERFYGWTKEELVNMNIGDINLMPAEEIKERVKKVLCHEGSHFEVKQKRADGSIRDVDLYCSSFTREGREFIQPIIIDVSARKAAEALIKQKNEELFLANAEKDKFFSIIAHDLRSPFHAILGLMEVIIHDKENLSMDEIVEFVTEIHNSGKNVYELLENLLEWANMKRGVLTTNPEILDSGKLIRDSISFLSLKAEQKKIEVKSTYDDCPDIYTDKHMTDTVLRNLLSNALKYTKRGGEVSVSATRTGEMVEIAVKDNGVGMSGEYAKKLFKLGEKIGTRGTEMEPTSGLGLLLCKEFVEKNGGTIWVESKEGEGSVFCFTLPAGER